MAVYPFCIALFIGRMWNVFGSVEGGHGILISHYSGVADSLSSIVLLVLCWLRPVGCVLCDGYELHPFVSVLNSSYARLSERISTVTGMNNGAKILLL